MSTRMGFEPTRAEHIGLAVQRLNHSATSSLSQLLGREENQIPGHKRNLHKLEARTKERTSTQTFISKNNNCAR